MRPNIVYVPINWSLRFYAACCIKSHVIPDIVYVPINWSLRFYAARYVKSHVIPDIVYVPINWSLRFYAARCVKSHAILTHIYFEYIGSLLLCYMLLTLLRLTTEKNYKSDPSVMKPVGPYRNIKHLALFSQADTKLISNCQIISSCQDHSYKSLLSL